jgi:hypothetical protein
MTATKFAQVLPESFFVIPKEYEKIPDGPTTPQTQSITTQPKNSWNIVPGVLWLNWDASSKDTLKITLTTLFDIEIAGADGTMNKDEIKIDGEISALGIVTGDGTVEAVWQQSNGGDKPGLWVEMSLTVLGKEWKDFKVQLLSWKPVVS